MDRSLVQAKQSRSCTSERERIAPAAAKTAMPVSVGLVRLVCGVQMPRRMRCPGRRTPHRRATADRTAVPIELTCARNNRSAPGVAPGWPQAMSPARDAAKNHVVSRSFSR